MDPQAAENGFSTSEFKSKTVVQVGAALLAVGTAFGVQLTTQQQTSLLLATLAIIAALEGVYTWSRNYRKKGTPGVDAGPLLVQPAVAAPPVALISAPFTGTDPQLTPEQVATVKSILANAIFTSTRTQPPMQAQTAPGAPSPPDVVT